MTFSNSAGVSVTMNRWMVLPPMRQFLAAMNLTFVLPALFFRSDFINFWTSAALAAVSRKPGLSRKAMVNFFSCGAERQQSNEFQTYMGGTVGLNGGGVKWKDEGGC